MVNKNYDIVSAYKGTVKDLNDIQKDDVVISIGLLVSSKEEDKYAELYVGINLKIDDLSKEFIPFEKLTKDKLIEWSLETLDEEKSKRIDRILRNKLDNYKEPVKTPVVSNKEVFKIDDKS